MKKGYLVLIVLVIFLGLATNSFADCTPANMTNWTIDAGLDCTFSGQVSIVGNLDIYGSLTLDGAKIIMNTTSDGSGHINASSGGVLNLTGSANITNNDSAGNDYNYGFNMTLGSYVNFSDSYIRKAGWEAAVGHYGVDIWSDDVYIDNMTIVDQDYVGIYLYYSDDVVIKNSEINATGSYGLWDRGGNYQTITGNNIWAHNQNAVQFYYPHDYSNFSSNNITHYAAAGYAMYINYVIRYCNFTFNNFTSVNEDGIYLNNYIYNNTFLNNTITAADYGIHIIGGTDTENNTFTNNTINSTGSAQRGIHIEAMDLSTFNDNTIYSAGHGIYGNTGLNNITIVDNYVNATTSGIWFNAANTFSNITGNNIWAHSQYGTVLIIATYADIDSNNITTYTTARAGLYIGTNSKYNNITDNNVTTTYKGLWLNTGCNNNTIKDNTVIRTAGSSYALDSSSSHSNTIVDNHFWGAYYVAVVSGSKWNNFTGNNITGTGHGLYLGGASYYNNFTDNYINASTYGVYLVSGPDNNRFVNNTIRSQGSYGLYGVTGVDNITVIGGNITNWAGQFYAIDIAGSNHTFEDVNITGGFPVLFTLAGTDNKYINCNLTATHATGDAIISRQTDPIAMDVTFYNTTLTAPDKDLHCDLNNGNITLVNCSFDDSNMLWDSDTYCNLSVGYYIDVLVKNSTDNAVISPANVTITGAEGTIQHNENTSATGYTTYTPILGYSKNGTTSSNYTWYDLNIISATADDFRSNTTTYNVTAGKTSTATIYLTDTSTPLTITWLGVTSTDWSTGSNWDIGAVPESVDYVVLNATPSNQPVLTASSNAWNLSIPSSSSLNTSGYNLQVENLTDVSGYMNITGGKLILNGTSDGYSSIAVNSGGTLFLNDTNITNGVDDTANYKFLISDGAYFYSYDSYIRRVGWSSAVPEEYGGVVIKTDNYVRMRNTTIVGDFRGMYVTGSSNGIYENNHISNINTGQVAVYNHGGSDNNTWTNNTIAGTRYGLSFHTSDNCIIENNTITTANSGGNAIALASSLCNNFTGNTVTATTKILASGEGDDYNNFTSNIMKGADMAYVTGSDNWYWIDNNITATSGDAVRLYGDTDSHNFTNNNLTANWHSGYGLYIQANTGQYHQVHGGRIINEYTVAGGPHALYMAGSDNRFTNVNITGSYGLHLVNDGGNNTWTGCNFTATLNDAIETEYTTTAPDDNIIYNATITSGGGAGDYDFWADVGGGNLTLVNCSFDDSLMLWDPDAYTNLTIKYYIDVHVMNSSDSSNIQDANVTLGDVNSAQVFNENTSSSGYTSVYEVLAYLQNWTTGSENFTNYDLHTASATADDYAANSTTWNVTLQKSSTVNLYLTTSDITPPQMTPNSNFSSQTSPLTYYPNNNIGFQANFTDNVALDTVQFVSNHTGSSVNYTVGGELKKLYLRNDSNLVSYYRFENNGNDETGIHDASYVNATYTASGKYGGAYDFDGSGQFINITDHDDLSFTDGSDNDEPFSISVWLNVDDVTSNCIASKYTTAPSNQREWILYFTADDKILLQLFDNSNSKNTYRKYNTALTSYQGSWMHLVTTYNGNETAEGISIYLNGVKVDDTSGGSGPYLGMENTGSNVNIGRFSATANMDGKIDDFAIFNRSLTAGEINEMYLNSLGYYVKNITDQPAQYFEYHWLANDTSDNTNETDDIGFTISKSSSLTAPVQYLNPSPATYASDYLIYDNFTQRITNNDGFVYYNYINDTIYDNSSGLVGYWKMDYNGDMYDYSGNGNDGTCTNCPSYTASGKFEGAYDFDGTNDYINLGTDIYTSSQMVDGSFSIWIKPDTIADSKYMLSLEGFVWLGRSDANCGTNNWCYQIYDGNSIYSKGTSIVTGEWTHVVGTWDGTNMRLYINTNLTDTDAQGSPVFDLLSRANVIGAVYSGVLNFDGIMDEVKIYNRALSPTEITRLYNLGTGDKFLTVGTYNITTNTTGNTNYSSASDSDSFTINKGLPVLVMNNTTTEVNNSNMFRYLKYDGDILDSSGNSRDASSNTAVYQSSGKFGGCYDWPKTSSQRMYVTEGIHRSGGYSLSLWINPDSFVGSTRIYFEGNSTDTDPKFDMMMGSDGKVKIYLMTWDAIALLNGITSTEALSTDTWNHILWTDQDGTASLFINGVKDATSFDYTYQDIQVDTYGIGAIVRGGVNSNHLNGQMDDFMFFTKNFTEDEAKELYETSAMYPYQTNFSCTAENNETALGFYRNDSVVSNPDPATYRAEESYYICNITSTENYTNSSFLLPLSTSKNTTTSFWMNLTIDDIEANKTGVTYPDTANATGNYSTTAFPTTGWLQQDITFTLYRNLTSIGTSNGANDTEVLGTGYWNYTYYTTGNTNYTSALKHFNLTIDQNTTIYPQITNLSPSNITYAANWYWANITTDLEAPNSDLTDTFWCGASVNSTSNQTLTNSSGNWNLNISNMPDGNHNITFYCNNTDTNYTINTNQSETYNFSIDTTAPIINIFTLSSNSITLEDTVTINWNVTDNGNVTYVIITSGATEIINTTYSTNSTTYTSTSAGTETITLTAHDDSGYSSTSSLSLTITAPVTTGDIVAGVQSQTDAVFLPTGEEVNVTLEEGKREVILIKKTDDVAITEVEIVANQYIPDTIFFIENVEYLPQTIQDHEGFIYSYIQLRVKNLDEDKIDSATIKFRVSRQWLDELDLDNSTVILSRYSDNRWEDLTTNRIGYILDYINYKSETPGFSYFAIVAYEEPDDGEDMGIFGVPVKIIQDILASEGFMIVAIFGFIIIVLYLVHILYKIISGIQKQNRLLSQELILLRKNISRRKTVKKIKNHSKKIRNHARSIKHHIKKKTSKKKPKKRKSRKSRRKKKK